MLGGERRSDQVNHCYVNLKVHSYQTQTSEMQINPMIDLDISDEYDKKDKSICYHAN